MLWGIFLTPVIMRLLRSLLMSLDNMATSTCIALDQKLKCGKFTMPLFLLSGLFQGCHQEPGAGYFPRLPLVWPNRLFLWGNRRKIEPKEIPSCLIPHLLVVFTWWVEILVTTLSFYFVSLLNDHHLITFVNRTFYELSWKLILDLHQITLWFEQLGPG